MDYDIFVSLLRDKKDKCAGSLTEKQNIVARLYLNGLSEKRICEKLNIVKQTLTNHKNRIISNLKLNFSLENIDYKKNVFNKRMSNWMKSRHIARGNFITRKPLSGENDKLFSFNKSLKNKENSYES